MSDKQKRFKELIEFANNFDRDTVLKQWDNWKEYVDVQLDNTVKTQDELNELMEILKKENLSYLTKNLLELAAEDLTSSKHDNEEW